jgi:molecular chaperone DnaJ
VPQRVASTDYYAVLGIDRGANGDDVKRAFRRLTKEWHPDRHPDDEHARERYTVINQAYTTLSDPALRAKYDAARLRQTSVELTQNFDVGSAKDLLRNVFGDVFGTRRSQRRRGRDLKYTLTIDLAEAVHGATKDIEFDAPGPCDVCQGSGTRPGGAAAHTCTNCDGRGEVKGEGLLSRRTRCGRCDGTGMIQTDACENCRGRGTARRPRTFTVRVPAGTEAGAERVLQGQGEPGRFGGDAGDLRVRINLRPHPWLTRDGDNIRCEAFVSVTEAARGAKVPVPTVDGAVVVEVPAGVRSGTKLRLRGKGIPGKGRTRGDQLVTVVVETPVLAADGTLGEVLDDLERRSAKSGVLPRRHAQRGAGPGGSDDGKAANDAS